MSQLIAIPSASQDCLDSAISSHFGKCRFYTLVSLEGEEVKYASVLGNIPHEHGSCLAPVQYLKDHGVDVLIAAGMGMRPLNHFGEVGIDVYYSANAKTVGEAVQGFLGAELKKFSGSDTCSGE